MHKSNKLAVINIYQIVVDVFILFISFVFAYYIKTELSPLFEIRNYLWFILLYAPIWILVMSSFKMYDSTTFNYNDRIFKVILISAFITSILLAAVIFYIKDNMFSRMLYLIFVFISIILLTVERYVDRHLFKRIRKSADRQVIVIGETSLSDKLESYLGKTNLPINVIGYVQLKDYAISKKHKNLGDISNLPEILKNNVVDEVIFALPRDYLDQIEEYVLLCEEMGITVSMALELYDLQLSKVYLSSIGTFPMLTFHTVSLNNFQLSIKRIMDIIGASIGLFFTAILYPFIFLAIKINSPGPIFFSQERMGRNGRKFKVYKFRSMYIDAEKRKAELMAQNQVKGGMMFKIKSDPRITKVGSILRKTSLDELPQFWNVLKGEMSLVGTRPPTLDEVCKYDPHHFRRISIKPGITGLWQVSGRSQITDFEDVVKLDTKYIDEWDIWLDIKIIIKTIMIVFNRRGAM